MAVEPTPPRIHDLHRSAFWIYGVTAMIMRDPFGIVLRHAAAAGWGDPMVRQEGLRGLVVLFLMSRQFLASGIYFDRVYLQPESPQLYPRRSYPLDFLLGMGELLAALGASTLVGVPTSMFAALVAVNLLWEPAWLALSAVARYSTLRMIAPGAAFNLATLAFYAATRALANESAASVVLLAWGGLHMMYLVREFNKS